jgi:hypothetical protein
VFDRGFKEILNSPVFRNFVISEDGKTSGIIVNIKQSQKLEGTENKSKEDVELIKDQIKKPHHQNILEIRQVIQSYSDVGKIYLGGIPMIADDMMTFISNHWYSSKINFSNITITLNMVKLVGLLLTLNSLKN